MTSRAMTRFLDSERNPWRYVWRCASRGHAWENGTCRRCGLPARASKQSDAAGGATVHDSGDSEVG